MDNLKEYLKSYENLAETYLALKIQLKAIKSPNTFDIIVQSVSRINADTRMDRIISEMDSLVERMTEIEDLINILPISIEKAVLEMRYINLMSTEEISSYLQKSPSTVKKYISNGLNDLYNNINKRKFI